MIYKNELKYRQAVVKALKSRGWFVQLIEVGATNRGVPDTVMIKGGRMIWVEYKNQPWTPPTPKVKVDYRPGQQAWMYEWKRRGGECCTIAAIKDKMFCSFFSKVIQDNMLTVKYYSTINEMLDGVGL